MCSRKWLIPLSLRVSKREPTRDQRATWARWSWGCGATTIRRPFASVAVVAASGALIAPAPPLVLILVFAPAPAVDLGLLDERGVDLDVVLRLVAQAADVEREGLVALGPDELLNECLAV